jgi:class 3 adenylate cyclase
MKILMGMMYMVPKKMRDSLPAMMMQKGRVSEGKNHPTIAMNITNMLICSKNCGTCPSYPGIRGEALFCASGPSKASVTENGCNCVTCPLFDRCSPYSIGYFCIHGKCSPKDTRTAIAKFTDTAKAYLQRFTFQVDDEEFIIEDAVKAEIIEDPEVRDIKLKFVGEKEVNSNSNTQILYASLNAGIPHTHVCGGRARCSTCRVIIEEGLEYCRPRNEREARLAKIKGFSPEVRLACQTTVDGDISLRRLVLDDHDISEAIRQGRGDINDVGREVDVTILFSDIRSFTAFSEKALPYDVIHILNRYFETIGNIIDINGGYIDKYMGDGIMAIFGLDKEIKDEHAYLAVKSSLEIQHAIDDFNNYLSQHFNHKFSAGVCIHSGTVIIGNLGFSKKKEYTALGDTVNTASRIESLNKKTGTAILTSESTYKRCHQYFTWGRKFKTKVKGKEEPVIVYEAIDFIL